MTEATLQLDARQRAMLDEMGVKVWWPTAERTLARTPASAAPEATATMAPEATMVAAAARTPTPRRAPGVAPAPAASVLIEPVVRLYDGSGPPEGGWLLVVDTPPSADGRHDDEPFAGDAGRLLQNMLRALQLDRGSAPVHLARVHRGAAGAPAGDGTALGTGFAAHASALAPRLVLALGPLSAQGLMQSDEPLGKLRGRIARAATGPGGIDMPLVASYHPVYLLRNPADKAKAWADLCLAAAEFEQAAAAPASSAP
jgi:uracil-DNA glycosylase family 4